MRQRLLFNAFAQVSPSHHNGGLWKSPWGMKHPYWELDTWIDIAKTIEAAKFDGLFLADHLGIMGPYKGNHRTIVEHGLVFPNDDAIIICAALAAVTEHLSLGFTSSIIQNQPFEFARLASTLDRISKGRAVWNFVTSSLSNSYRNVGFDRDPTAEERYKRADEFIEVVMALWEGSWAFDAVKRDPETGIYADPEKIFRINYDTDMYKVQGPLLTEPSPQRTPFIFTAGMSPNAFASAARNAEALLIAARDYEHVSRIAKQLNDELAKVGRRPGDVKILQMMYFVVGSTTAEAKRKHEEIMHYAYTLGKHASYGGVMGIDLGKYSIDEEFDVRTSPFFRGMFYSADFEPGRTSATIREIMDRLAYPPIVGTPEEIADELEKWQDAGIHGVNLGDYQFHQSYHDVAEYVMPELRKRGLAQTEYAPGTFREKVFGEGPHISERHPGARFRGAFTDKLA